ncbi:GNAT family N-acetyltransferase [Streptomyces sp. Je 1-4]|uniref:GNAT family N-acetyltransferase n=1 Tax=Streptomyces TaxID=1883 RepID=UPI001ABFDA65|nr:MULTISPECIES: GNAT family N-acetyltransferase [unclassified Streptomyces]UYB43226.1 GNAT family N-acetyltransferase [Streptomyces sp. Je 1-4]UZQ39592.1 GNAT family N-acetyltransferase [Streptomyces sp. Je 1-4] [Streptomyces sp. Je 1-4 4N24]UZQ47009.1 GNAT family N-acetyltransferase [Streptomyces sp. Je 1-4] [Streptomyces sp. Je 1-4 4N24_ara]
MTAAPRPLPATRLTLRHTTVGDPLARPLLDELTHEYRTRYEKPVDLSLEYPAEEFAPPGGAFLLLLADGSPVAGGAYRRYDARTAEFKRIWTHSAHRRRGLARRVLDALERDTAARGYTRVCLTTGPRQPEAKGLYLAAGYRPLFDLSAAPESIGPLPFEKHLESPRP